MKKIILFLISLNFVYANNFGIIPGTEKNYTSQTYNYIDSALKCSSNYASQCSEWKINLFDENSKETPFFKPYEEAKYLKKNVTIREIINAGLDFFLTDSKQAKPLNYSNFVVMKEVDLSKNKVSQTIQKAANDFVYKEDNADLSLITLDTNNVGTSFLIGQIDGNFGMASAIAVRKNLRTFDGKNYITLELERVNFAKLMEKRFNEYCDANPSGSFSFLYDPLNVLALSNLLEKPDLLKTLKPEQHNAYESGLINFPCSYMANNTIKQNKFNFLKLQINLKNKPYSPAPNYSSFYNKSSNSFTSSIHSEHKYFFQDNGYTLNLPTHDQDTILRIATSFFSTFMEDRKIEYAVITKSLPATITTQDWKEKRKCGWKRKRTYYYHKKTLYFGKEFYTMSPVTQEMPFSESATSFSVEPAKYINSYAPTNLMPSNEDAPYYITPDKHIQTHILSYNNFILNDLTNAGKIRNNVVVSGTSVKSGSCGWGGIFKIILVVVVVVIAVLAAPLLPALAPMFVGTTGVIASGIVAAALALVVAPIIFPGEKFSGYFNPVSTKTLNTEFSYDLAKNSGSSFYQQFAVIKDSIEKIANPNYFINTLSYHKIKGSNESGSAYSYQIRDDVADNYLDIIHLPRFKGSSVYNSYNHITHITKLHSASKPFGNYFYVWNNNNWRGGSSLSNSPALAFNHSKTGLGNLNLKEYKVHMKNQMSGLYSSSDTTDIWGTRTILYKMLELYLPTKIDDLN